MGGIRSENVRSYLRYLHTTKLFWFRGSVKGPAICAKLAFAAKHVSKLGAALGIFHEFYVERLWICVAKHNVRPQR